MVDHAECVEEQQYEAEALEAIYDTHFSSTISNDGLTQWHIDLLPDMSDLENNHVACKLIADLPVDYPHGNLPVLSIRVTKGLAPEHADIIENLAQAEAQANEGAPSIFAVAEKIKEWMMENNVKGLEDTSMYAQSMRKTTQPTVKVRLRVSSLRLQHLQETLIGPLILIIYRYDFGLLPLCQSIHHRQDSFEIALVIWSFGRRQGASSAHGTKN